MSLSDNPLRKYFRQPALHLRLPSGGRFYPPGVLDLPPNGEIPILPMTAIDEITSRTPDALFNGSAVAEIFKSCVPNISDPWQVTAADLNALLAAVRLASYGNEMEIASRCPKCGEIHDVTVDLREILDRIHCPDYDQPLKVGDLTIYVAPLTYQQINEANTVQYEDQKILQMVNDSDMDEQEKMKQLGDAFKRITALTVRSIGTSVKAIQTSDTMVTDPQQILEFLINCPKPVFESIKEYVVSLRSKTDFAPLGMTCDKCKHKYQQDFTLDMSNFFELAS